MGSILQPPRGFPLRVIWVEGRAAMTTWLELQEGGTGITYSVRNWSAGGNTVRDGSPVRAPLT